MIVDEKQFCLMSEKGTIDAVFILRRLQEGYHAKGKKLYTCFVDLEKSFDKYRGKFWNGQLGRKEYHMFWLDQ